MKEANLKYNYQVAFCGCRIQWIKLNKWPLGRKKGSFWFYLTGFDHDPMLLGSCIERKSNGFLVAFCKT